MILQIFPNEFGVKKPPFFFLDFLFDCFKSQNHNKLQIKSEKKKWWNIFRRRNETLLYDNANNANIELSHEALNIISKKEQKINYDACSSSAVYAENFENEEEKKVTKFFLFNLNHFFYLKKANY